MFNAEKFYDTVFDINTHHKNFNKGDDQQNTQQLLRNKIRSFSREGSNPKIKELPATQVCWLSEHM